MCLMEWIGRRLARYLVQPSKRGSRIATCDPELLAITLRRGDVLLVEGSTRISTAVKYLTQSTWSHAALCIAEAAGTGDIGRVEFVEADVSDGVRRVPLGEYSESHTRICRAVGITPEEIDRIVGYAVSRIGYQYDLKNIVDLARYLVQTPPVPVRWRRRLLALGSGDPTRAICSSLIAQAFQSIRYPILPAYIMAQSRSADGRDCYDEILHIRHHSLFAPSDFDISPYFQVVKPTLENGFDPHALNWIDIDENQTVDEALDVQLPGKVKTFHE